MQVYQMYKDMLYNVSLRILRHEHDAQDMVHDAFIKAFQNIQKLDNDLHLGPWLKRIVVNCSLDFLKKRKKLSWMEESIEIKDDASEEPDIHEGPYNLNDVKAAIDALKEKYRIIIVLYLIENYSHKEIAQHLGLKESTVRNQYRRGKIQLQQLIQNKVMSWN